MATRTDEAAARTEILLRDAEEDLQRERLREFWRQWGSTIVGMALMLVIGTAAGVAWREWRQDREEKATLALLGVIEAPSYTPAVEEQIKTLDGKHAAIAYLSAAGKVQAAPKKEDTQKILSGLYGSAAREADDDTIWGWLARWNSLRLRMDDESEDSARLLKDYERLAGEMEDSGFAALAYADAAIIAGERLKDPARALDYVARAEKRVPRATPMATIIADLRHLYEIRAQSKDAAAPAEAAPKEEKE